jgi:hypothetical protein
MKPGRMCEHCCKWLYPTYWQANGVAMRARRRGERMVAYRCPHARRGYHVGHAGRRRTRP